MKRILAVDDELDLLAVMTEFFEARYEVVTIHELDATVPVIMVTVSTEVGVPRDPH